MRVAGIIAEYNPFHNGHKFHMEETKKATGADYCIVIMSGDFVQRGGPAVVNKYLRTRTALENGADLVIQMPVIGSTASAGEFARCGIQLLSRLGVVTDISFGCEAASEKEKEILTLAAGYLLHESGTFKKILSEEMHRGKTYPVARAEALRACFQDDFANQEMLCTILESPNNILALEYLKENMDLKDPMRPCMITRKGASYHDDILTEETVFPSATAIRNHISNAYSKGDGLGVSLDGLRAYLPSSAVKELEKHLSGSRPLFEDAFSDMLYYKLLSQKDRLSLRYSQNADLSNTVKNRLEQFVCWTQFASLCKGKNQTLTSVNRHLTHILLGIDASLVSVAKEMDYAPYARVLGFRQDAAPLLSRIDACANISMITQPARALRNMEEKEAALFRLDLMAADLFSYVSKQSADEAGSELRNPLVYVS